MEMYALYLETKDYPEDVEYYLDKELAKNRMVDLLIEKNFEYVCVIYIWSFDKIPMKLFGLIEYNLEYGNNCKNKSLSKNDIKLNFIYHYY